jgi:hypothetical protein
LYRVKDGITRDEYRSSLCEKFVVCLKVLCWHYLRAVVAKDSKYQDSPECGRTFTLPYTRQEAYSTMNVCFLYPLWYKDFVEVMEKVYIMFVAVISG